MAAGALDSRATIGITSEPELKRPVVEQARFPLVWKLFGLTALIIVIVVAIAVGVTIQRATVIAQGTVNRSISGAARLFDEFERQRLGRLALPANLVGNDPTFVAYIQGAMAGEPPAPGGAATIDLASIADQLEQRRQAFGSDLVILLDDQGRVVARTDQPALTAPSNEDLYEESPLVKKVVDDASVTSTSGVLPLGNRLYDAAVAPIGAGANNVRVGYLVNAYVIDDTFANRISEGTNAGVIFVSPRSLVRSTNAPSFTMQQMSGVDRVLRSGKPVPPSTLQIERNRYVMTVEPLTAIGSTVGAAVFVRSLDRELAPFREIENSLLFGGGAALLLAFVLSWFIARRMTRPVEQLAGIAQAVTAGDYSVRPTMERADEIGILSRAFAKMISALRDKADLEELYAQMSARSREREAAKLDEGAVVVTDIRGLPAANGDPEAIVGVLGRAIKIQQAEVARQEGQVRGVEGHQLVSIFRGDRSVLHAIRAARAINEELAASESPSMSVSVGVASGTFVTGSVEMGGEDGRTIVGSAPLLAGVLAAHAPDGYAWIAWDTAQASGGEVLTGSTREQIAIRSHPQPIAVASMPLVGFATGTVPAMGSASATVRVGGTDGRGASVMSELPPGTTFAGRYRIDQILGRGGMGIVYKAVDTQLDETVALKMLPGDAMARSPEQLERFKREIRLARKITHRNVLRTYDYGEADGVYFISMEYIRGYTLAELIDESAGRALSPRVTLGIARQICRGLQAAHEQGIIHRDIKPQNVLIDHKGEVKLMDFGVARMAEAQEGLMTQAGLIVGTPHYMSPEQVEGKQLDARSDVYAMGVLIYEMLAGKKPFEGGSLTSVLTAHLTSTPTPLAEIRPEVGREINAIVMRCLSKEAKERYTDAGALLHDLDALPA